MKHIVTQAISKRGCEGEGCPFQERCKLYGVQVECLKLAPLKTVGFRRDDGMWECKSYREKLWENA